MSQEPGVQHLPEETRFVYRADGHEAELTYRRRKPETIDFLHTGVPDALGGRGVGSQLARAGLTYARENGLLVRPFCPFVRGWIKRHAEFADLVSPDYVDPDA